MNTHIKPQAGQKALRFSLQLTERSCFHEDTPFNRALVGYYQKLDERYVTLLKEAGENGLRDEALNEKVRLAFMAVSAVKAAFEMLPWSDKESDTPEDEQFGVFQVDSALEHLDDLTADLLGKRS